MAGGEAGGGGWNGLWHLDVLLYDVGCVVGDVLRRAAVHTT